MRTLFSSHRHEPNDHRHALRVQHHVLHTTIAAHALCARQMVRAHTHAYVVTSVCMCVLIFLHTAYPNGVQRVSIRRVPAYMLWKKQQCEIYFVKLYALARKLFLLKSSNMFAHIHVYEPLICTIQIGLKSQPFWSSTRLKAQCGRSYVSKLTAGKP